MANKSLAKIFLSASVPSTDRDKVFYETADIIAIRDSVRALAAVIVPYAHLIWGGHPSITPLIRNVMNRVDVSRQEHMTIYQSAIFKKDYPVENDYFENIIEVPAVNDDKIASIAKMRYAMIHDHNFDAAIFIGGMEGIFIEYQMFVQAHPNALVIPVATTGAAAKVLYQKNPANYNARLMDDYAYMSLFRDLLNEFIFDRPI